MPSQVLAHVLSSILPPSAAMAADARVRGGDLAGWLAGARHSPRPAAARRIVLVVAADHGVIDPGLAMGAGHPTAITLAALDGGETALGRVIRAAGATLLLVDAGTAEPTHVPKRALGLSPGHGSDIWRPAPALTPVDGRRSRSTPASRWPPRWPRTASICSALGAVGLGGDIAAAAVIAALTGGDADLAPADGRTLVAAGLAQLPPGASPIEIVAAVGGRDLALLAGVILTAAAAHVPVSSTARSPPRRRCSPPASVPRSPATCAPPTAAEDPRPPPPAAPSASPRWSPPASATARAPAPPWRCRSSPPPPPR